MIPHVKIQKTIGWWIHYPRMAWENLQEHLNLAKQTWFSHVIPFKNNIIKASKPMRWDSVLYRAPWTPRYAIPAVAVGASQRIALGRWIQMDHEWYFYSKDWRLGPRNLFLVHGPPTLWKPESPKGPRGSTNSVPPRSSSVMYFDTCWIILIYYYMVWTQNRGSSTSNTGIATGQNWAKPLWIIRIGGHPSAPGKPWLSRLVNSALSFMGVFEPAQAKG